MLNHRYRFDGTAIATGRRTLNLTQTQLAERLGVAQTAVSQWERGEVAPSIKNILLAADALDLSITDLFVRDEEFVDITEEVDALLVSLA